MMDLLNEKLKRLAESVMGDFVCRHKMLENKSERDIEVSESMHVYLEKKDDQFINRIKNRVANEEIGYQENLESILEMTDQNLRDNDDDQISEKDVDDYWFQKFTSFAKEISNEDLRLLWAKILANEVKRPDTYSLRTLDFLRLLSRKEAEFIRKMAQYVVCDVNGGAYILKGKTTEEYKFDEIMMLMELGLLGNLSSIAIKGEKNGEESINFFLHHYGTGTFIITKQEKLLIPIYKLTSIGKEILGLNDDVPLNINYMRDFAENLVKGDPTMSVTCAPILKIVGNDVDLDEEHAYIKLGTKYQNIEE